MDFYIMSRRRSRRKSRRRKKPPTARPQGTGKRPPPTTTEANSEMGSGVIPPPSSPTTSKKNRQGCLALLKSIPVLIGLLSGFVPVVIFYVTPKVAIEPLQAETDRHNNYPPLRVTNTSSWRIYDVHAGFRVTLKTSGYIEMLDAPFGAQSGMVPFLESQEPTTIQLGVIFGGPHVVEAADIEVIIWYKQSFALWERQTSARLRLIRGVDGICRWQQFARSA